MKADEAPTDSNDAFLEELSSFQSRLQPQRMNVWLIGIGVYLCMIVGAGLMTAWIRGSALLDLASGLPDLLLDTSIALRFRIVMVVEFVYSIGVLVLAAAVAWLILRFIDKSRRFRKYCVPLLLAMVIWNICGPTIMASLAPEFFAADRSISLTIVWMVIPALMISAYLRRSQRAKDVFVRP